MRAELVRKRRTRYSNSLEATSMHSRNSRKFRMAADCLQEGSAGLKPRKMLGSF